jgi:hypothetical protein
MELLRDYLESEEFNKKIFIHDKNERLIVYGDRESLKHQCNHKLQSARVAKVLDYGNTFYIFVDFMTPLKLGDVLRDYFDDFVYIYDSNGQAIIKGKSSSILRIIKNALYNKEVFSIKEYVNDIYIGINL